MLVLLDILLKCQQLLLQLIAQTGQRIADVIGQLLVEHALQVRRPEPVGQVPVRWVTGIVYNCQRYAYQWDCDLKRHFGDPCDSGKKKK